MKKLLKKILPKFIINKLVKKKYEKYNIQKHDYNIDNNFLIEVKCNNIEKYEFLKNTLKQSFGGILNIRGYSVYFYPIAIIKIPQNIDIYLKEIGTKSRNMNVKAIKNGIDCKLFNWNEYLDDIYNINTSSLNRQGRKMDSAYMNYPEKVANKNEKDFTTVFIGAFNQEKLVGYIELYVYGNFAMTNRILGHKEYLNLGVMNLMMKYCVEYAIDAKIEYINYLTMQNRENNSLSAFKNRVGFREYSLMELK